MIKGSVFKRHHHHHNVLPRWLAHVENSRMNIVGRESSLPTYGQMYEAFQEPLLREWKVSHMPCEPAEEDS